MSLRTLIPILRCSLIMQILMNTANCTSRTHKSTEREQFVRYPLLNSGWVKGDTIDFVAEDPTSQPFVRISIKASQKLPETLCTLNNSVVQIFTKDSGTSGPLYVGSFCGGQAWDYFPVATTGIRVLINDSSVLGSITLTIKHACFRACSNMVSAVMAPRYARTPGYPLGSTPYNRCTVSILAPVGYRVRVSLRYSTEGYSNCVDSNVSLHNTGYATHMGNVDMGTWCGGEDNEYASFDCMTFVTTSRIQNNESVGLEIKYWSEPTIWCWEVLDVYNRAGVLTSPGYPGYTDLYECRWTLTRLRYSIEKVIAINVTSSDLDNSTGCTKDSVSIYASTNVHLVKRLAYWCGTNTPHFEFYISRIVIIFKSGSKHTQSHTGFVLSYQAEESSCKTSLRATTKLWTLTSLNYPEPYPHYQKCKWTITAVNRLHVVKLSVLTIDMNFTNSNNCIKVYNGITEYRSYLLKEICWNVGSLIVSTLRSVTVVFVSGLNQHKHKGFRIGYSSGQYSDDIVARIQPVSVTFPGKGIEYESGYSCTWRISAKLLNMKKGRVSLRFTRVNTSCPQDIVTVKEGFLRRWSFCGHRDHSYLSYWRATLSINFNTYTKQGTGFTMTYSAYNYTGCDVRTIDVYAQRSTQYILSPGSFSGYYDKLSCRWRVRGIDDSVRIHMVIHIYHILGSRFSDTACIDDFLNVYDGYSSAGIYLGRICGKDDIIHFNSTGRFFYIEFLTDDVMTGTGFKITYEAMESANTDVNRTSMLVSPIIIIGSSIVTLLIIIACSLSCFVAHRRRLANRQQQRQSARAIGETTREDINMDTFSPPPSYYEIEHRSVLQKDADTNLPTYNEAVDMGMIQTPPSDNGDDVNDNVPDTR